MPYAATAWPIGSAGPRPLLQRTHGASDGDGGVRTGASFSDADPPRFSASAPRPASSNRRNADRIESTSPGNRPTRQPSISCELPKGARTRAEEEHVATQLILNAVAEACGVEALCPTVNARGRSRLTRTQRRTASVDRACCSASERNRVARSAANQPHPILFPARSIRSTPPTSAWLKSPPSGSAAGHVRAVDHERRQAAARLHRDCRSASPISRRASAADACADVCRKSRTRARLHVCRRRRHDGSHRRSQVLRRRCSEARRSDRAIAEAGCRFLCSAGRSNPRSARYQLNSARASQIVRRSARVGISRRYFVDRIAARVVFAVTIAALTAHLYTLYPLAEHRTTRVSFQSVAPHVAREI